MPNYRIHRLKDHLRQQFRSAPHVSGTAGVKPRDYLPGVVAGEAGSDTAAEFSGETISAASPYAAFFELKDGATPLVPGDLLEDESGALRIFKYVGFEEAQWVLPEVPAAPAGDAAANAPVA